MVVGTGLDMPSSAIHSIVALKNPIYLIAFPIAVQACIPGRRGIFANDECYIEWDLASNCDPLSDNPRLQNVEPFGRAAIRITTDSSSLNDLTCWVCKILTVLAGPSHTAAKWYSSIQLSQSFEYAGHIEVCCVSVAHCNNDTMLLFFHLISYPWQIVIVCRLL